MLFVFCFSRTHLFQGDDHGAGSKGVPGGAVVRWVEVRLHDVVDGEGGEDGPALGWRFTLLHGVPLHQGSLLLLPYVLLPRPNLKHTLFTLTLVMNDMLLQELFTCIRLSCCTLYAQNLSRAIVWDHHAGSPYLLALSLTPCDLPLCMSLEKSWYICALYKSINLLPIKAAGKILQGDVCEEVWGRRNMLYLFDFYLNSTPYSCNHPIFPLGDQ